MSVEDDEKVSARVESGGLRVEPEGRKVDISRSVSGWVLHREMRWCTLTIRKANRTPAPVGRQIRQ